MAKKQHNAFWRFKVSVLAGLLFCAVVILLVLVGGSMEAAQEIDDRSAATETAFALRYGDMQTANIAEDNADGVAEFTDSVVLTAKTSGTLSGLWIITDKLSGEIRLIATVKDDSSENEAFLLEAVAAEGSEGFALTTTQPIVPGTQIAVVFSETVGIQAVLCEMN